MASCRETQDMIEALAADETTATPAVREHLTTCVRCAASLALARRIEATLGPRRRESAPARFTTSAIARVRRERWRAEQRVDRAFNLAIAASIVLLVSGLTMLFNVSGVVTLVGNFSQIVAEGVRAAADRVVPALSTYLAGTAIILTAAGVWWWAEGSR
jgi:anti-sigma factor RsiW